MKLTVTAFGVMAAAAALAAAKVEVSSLPPSQYADTEADTNTVVCSAAVADNRFRLFLELDAMTNNCVMVEFGVDSDSNGALERNEIEFSVGWDCGEWIWRDSRGGANGYGATVAADAQQRSDGARTGVGLNGLCGSGRTRRRGGCSQRTTALCSTARFLLHSTAQSGTSRES